MAPALSVRSPCRDVLWREKNPRGTDEHHTVEPLRDGERRAYSHIASHGHPHQHAALDPASVQLRGKVADEIVERVGYGGAGRMRAQVVGDGAVIAGELLDLWLEQSTVESHAVSEENCGTRAAIDQPKAAWVGIRHRRLKNSGAVGAAVEQVYSLSAQRDRHPLMRPKRRRGRHGGHEPMRPDREIEVSLAA